MTTKTFRAEAITADTREDAARLAVTFADAAGRETTLSITPEIAAALAKLAQAFAQSAPASGILPTKMPSGFAIGSGRFEPVVLVRFEDDTPYGLSAGEALRLGEALIEEARQMASVPPPLRQ